MSTTLSQELQSSLDNYSVNVEYWEPDAGDTFALPGQREFLQRHLGALSDSQRAKLADIDKGVLDLCEARYGGKEDGDDVRTLRFVADIINGRAEPGGAIPYAERLRGYREEVEFALDQGEGPALRPARERIAALRLSPDELAELETIDAGALELVTDLDYIAPYLLQDDPAQPPEKWWWHLGAIRRREFPPEKLPPFLRPA